MDKSEKTFAYHEPSEQGLVNIRKLREAFSTVADVIEDRCPNSREKAVALTNLETAAMWAIKAVAHNDPHSEIAS